MDGSSAQAQDLPLLGEPTTSSPWGPVPGSQPVHLWCCCVCQVQGELHCALGQADWGSSNQQLYL